MKGPWMSQVALVAGIPVMLMGLLSTNEASPQQPPILITCPAHNLRTLQIK